MGLSQQKHGGRAECADLRAQEDGHRCFLLQARTWSHQDQWLPDRARRARDPALQSVRAGAAPRLGSLLQRGYPYLREGRRFHLASLRHPPGDREVACGLLPEVRRESQKKEIKDILLAYD